MDPYGDGGRYRRWLMDVNPSSFRSGHRQHEAIKHMQGMDDSKPLMAKERHEERRKVNDTARKKKRVTNRRSRDNNKLVRHDRSSSSNRTVREHQSPDARGIAKFRAVAEAALSHLQGYKDITAAIDDLDNVVCWYKYAGCISRGKPDAHVRCQS